MAGFSHQEKYLVPNLFLTAFLPPKEWTYKNDRPKNSGERSNLIDHEGLFGSGNKKINVPGILLCILASKCRLLILWFTSPIWSCPVITKLAFLKTNSASPPGCLKGRHLIKNWIHLPTTCLSTQLQMKTLTTFLCLLLWCNLFLSKFQKCLSVLSNRNIKWVRYVILSSQVVTKREGKKKKLRWN